MTPRRVLLRIKKLRRFLDERIADAARDREVADDPETRAEAAGRLAACQEIRAEMVGERLDLEEVELEPDAAGDGETGTPAAEEGGDADVSAEEDREAEEAPAGG